MKHAASAVPAPGLAAGPMAARPLSRPLRVAGATAALFLLFSLLYLQISGVLSARAAGSVEQLARIEMAKGIAFMVAAAAGLFALQYALLTRLEKSHRELMAHRERLLEFERRAIAGTFASSTAHDLNNLLMSCYGSLSELELLAEDLERTGDSEAATRVRAAQESYASATADMTALSRRLANAGRNATPEEWDEVDVGMVVTELARLVRRHKVVRDCKLSVAAEAGARLRARQVLLRQALVNLLLNAAQAAGPGGHIEVEVSKAADGAVRIRVSDDGPGTGGRGLEEISEPFFSTKPEGSGLGLLSVKACAQGHNGALALAKSPLGGCCFELELRDAGERPSGQWKI